MTRRNKKGGDVGTPRDSGGDTEDEGGGDDAGPVTLAAIRGLLEPVLDRLEELVRDRTQGPDVPVASRLCVFRGQILSIAWLFFIK